MILMPGTRWNEEDLKNLTKWYCIGGMSRAKIGTKLGRTIMAIDNQIERSKLTRQNQAPQFDGYSNLSVIYFITDSDNNKWIKIGTTNDLGKRLAQLQVGNPNPLRVLGVIDIINERFIHEKFAEKRGVGEWFEADEELMTFIKERTRKTDNPTPTFVLLDPTATEPQ